MGVERIRADELPATTKALAEVLVRSLGLDPAANLTRIEVSFNAGGVVLELWKHHRYSGSALAEFDRFGPDELADLLRERIEFYRSQG